MKKAKWYFSFVLCILFFYFAGKNVNATESHSDIEGTEQIEAYYKEFYEDLKIDHLEDELKVINRQYDRKTNVSFEDILSMLLDGNVEGAVGTATEGFYESVTDDIVQNREMIVKLLVLVMIAAVFHNYSSVFQFSYVGEQGFYITYLMIAILLLQSFQLVYQIAEETVCYLKEIMECMLPALYMSVMLCGGLTTSQMVNSMFLWMLSVVEKILLNIVLPGIWIYFLIVVLNQINEKDRFSKLASLIKQGLQFLLKAMVTGIIGLNVMKGILVPVYDNAKYNVLQKGLSVIPGGNTFSGLSTILLGAGVLIKNSIGITAVVILLILGSIPLLKIFCFYVVYRVILALVQPISDNRILKGIQGIADSTGMLLRATTTSMVLSVLSVAIVLLTTNVRLYTG